jgi:hypothetical protein
MEIGFLTLVVVLTQYLAEDIRPADVICLTGKMEDVISVLREAAANIY